MNLLDNRVVRRIIFSDLYPKTQIVEDISDGSYFPLCGVNRLRGILSSNNQYFTGITGIL